jgi:hypothetical protein
MNCRHSHIAVVVGLLFAGCAPDFGGDLTLKSLSYAEYISQVGVDSFDPTGASDISYRCFSTRDGYDAWWRFTVSQQNYTKLLTAVAKANDGPNPIAESEDTAYPAAWRPDGTAPTWWDRQAGTNAKAVAWCHRAGGAERRHGWYFLYDPDAERMWCWHWNHQWSAAQCR